MATMSVNMVGDNGAGYGKLGETLAKAIWGDPELEMNMALKRQDYETEAWRRKVMDAQAANQQSVADTNEWELALRQNSIEALRDFHESLVEPPAPVQITTPQAPVLAVPAHKVKTSVVPLADITNPDAARALPQPVLGTEASTDIAGLPALAPVDPLLYETPPPKVVQQPVTAEQLRQFELEKAARRAAVDQIVAGGGPANAVAQGLGIGEGIIKLESRDPKKRGEGEILYTGKTPEPGAGDTELVQKLRKEFQGTEAFKKWEVVHTGYKNMRQAMDTLTNMQTEDDPRRGPADMRLLYNYLKLLDPNTGVKEGEYASAADAGGKVAPYLNLYNSLVAGDKLDQRTREAFLRQAQGMYDIASQDLGPGAAQLVNEAKLINVDPSRVVTQPEQISPWEGTVPNSITPAMIAAKIQEALPNVINKDEALMLLIDEQRKQPGGR